LKEQSKGKPIATKNTSFTKKKKKSKKAFVSDRALGAMTT
jgi:hypothetical protein